MTVSERDTEPTSATAGREELLFVQMVRTAGARAEGRELDRTRQHGFGTEHTPASYPAGPVTVSRPVASVFVRKPFFLSHRDKNLASRHGKCQGSCLGPLFRQNLCQKQRKTKCCIEERE